MTADVYTAAFTVRTADASPHGLATPAAWAAYLQEAAGAHAERLGFGRAAMLAEGRAWVLATLRLTVERPARWQETVRVETWPSGIERLFATREFVLTNADGVRLGAATSAWALLDLASRRPVRPRGRLLDLQPPARPAPLAHAFDPLDPPAEADEDAADAGSTDRLRVRYGDLDLNAHVNNARFVAWAAEQTPADVLAAHRLAALAIQFRAELTLGDAVRARTQPTAAPAFPEAPAADDAPAFRHALYRCADAPATDHDADAPGRLAAVAHTRWTPVADE
jgi:acyl-ACP thioesterase